MVPETFLVSMVELVIVTGVPVVWKNAPQAAGEFFPMVLLVTDRLPPAVEKTLPWIAKVPNDTVFSPLYWNVDPETVTGVWNELMPPPELAPKFPTVAAVTA
jgi:hypothetical protein